MGSKNKKVKIGVKASILACSTLVAGLAFASSNSSYATTCISGTASTVNGTTYCVGEEASATVSATASVNVVSACTLSGGGNNYSGSVANGSTTEFGSSGTAIKAVCNDPSGYALYAVGYSGNSTTTPTNTQLISNVSSDNNISTGNSGSNSYWAFKVNAINGTYKPVVVGSPDDTITGSTTNYANYQAVPASYTKVAFFTSNTDAGSNPTGSNVNPNYKVYISSSQPAGTYTGAVKYTLVHPHTASAPSE